MNPLLIFEYTIPGVDVDGKQISLQTAAKLVASLKDRSQTIVKGITSRKGHIITLSHAENIIAGNGTVVGTYVPAEQTLSIGTLTITATYQSAIALKNGCDSVMMRELIRFDDARCALPIC